MNNSSRTAAAYAAYARERKRINRELAARIGLTPARIVTLYTQHRARQQAIVKRSSELCRAVAHVLS